MRRLTGKDAIFLYMETPSSHMHVAFAGVLDPSTMPEPKSGRDLFNHLYEHLEQRLHLFPPFRQRLVEVPFDLDHPVLIEDPDFDLRYHVRRAALPAPGGRRELEDFVGQVASRPMDRSHPLWEFYIVEGIEGGRWAIVAKAHHVIVDGVGGNEILVNLLDLTPEPREVEPPEQPWRPDDVPGDLRLMAQAATHNLKSPVRGARAITRTLGTVVDVVRDKVRGEDDAPLVTLGPKTIFNEPTGPHRRVALGRVSFADVKAVKDGAGVKVNDVVLAMCGRGLHRFLAALGDEPDKPLVAAVPMSIREPGDDSVGNRVAGMTVPLADDLADPLEQLKRISIVTRPAKDRLGALTADLLTDWTQFPTPALAVQAFRFYSRMNLTRRHPPVANVTISNVPGPDFPIYMAGSQLEGMYPIGPLVFGQALNITVVSYLDDMCLGVVVDPDLVPEPSALIDEIDKALSELLEAVEHRGDHG